MGEWGEYGSTGGFQGSGAVGYRIYPATLLSSRVNSGDSQGLEQMMCRILAKWPH